MMKFPSVSAGGMAPSGNSLAVTYPGVCGSRVGGVGRFAWAVAEVTPINQYNTAPQSTAA